MFKEDMADDLLREDCTMNRKEYSTDPRSKPPEPSTKTPKDQTDLTKLKDLKIPSSSPNKPSPTGVDEWLAKDTCIGSGQMLICVCWVSELDSPFTQQHEAIRPIALQDVLTTLSKSRTTYKEAVVDYNTVCQFIDNSEAWTRASHKINNDHMHSATRSLDEKLTALYRDALSYSQSESRKMFIGKDSKFVADLSNQLTCLQENVDVAIEQLGKATKAMFAKNQVELTLRTND